jgi:hypothetical protein
VGASARFFSKFPKTHDSSELPCRAMGSHWTDPSNLTDWLAVPRRQAIYGKLFFVSLSSVGSPQKNQQCRTMFNFIFNFALTIFLS